ncbi:tRNA (5-methylaminomethyl-2-thiouridine)(34)-methyltransferase MnmD [Brevundimonas sp. NPDC092305]|uniref:tRNA (5-methylaminomethyl-2-thiouridine)(34)-methyltransferase MnmD n=1 Tax=Brevundimonas sp. NPDC092305 TaxID=3363957 RepID=UPI00380975A1
MLWADDGAPRSGRFDDVYFSREDGLAETRAVFLEGCGLPEAWAGRSRFVVAELGFGTGLNIAALLDLWRRTRPRGGRLHVFSIEGFPLSREDAARALSAWPELADAAKALLDAWPPAAPGFHRLDLPGFDATLDLAIGDVEWALGQWSGRADAWFLDGFAPSTNPGMWSETVFQRIAALSAPGARVATFTVAGAVRRGLAAQGFNIEKRPGHGRKRERLEARLPTEPAPEVRPLVAVIGAGIAGAALARAFTRLGVGVTVIEADGPGAGASGFPAALVTPRFDLGDADIAGLFAAALERAGSLYAATPDAVVHQGVLQLEHSARDGARFPRLAEQDLWPESAMTAVSAGEASARLGEPVRRAGLMMNTALAIRPEAVLNVWLDGSARLRAHVARIDRVDDRFRLVDPSGEMILEADAVILAAGHGSTALCDAQLGAVRGQADWVEGATVAPVAWGGYAVPTGEGFLFGATHDRDDVSTEARADDTARNRATLAAALPALAETIADLPVQSRAAVRATTRDRLPLAGAIPGHPGLFILGGLGSRGFCAAPLLAEHVAALVAVAPSPITAAQAALVDPARFQSCAEPEVG